MLMRCKIMTTKEIFASRLCEIRESKDLTRQKVADDLGISRASLEYYEKGKRTPDINTINLIADYFQVSVDYLFGKTKCISCDEDMRKICDYFGTDINTVLGLKKITKNNEKYGDEFRKIIHSSHFAALLYHIYLSFDLKKELGETLVNELEKVTVLSEESEEYLFNEYGSDGYYSSSERECREVDDKIDLNEYRAQKELSALMNILSKEPSSSESYAEYVEWYVPTQKFFDEIIQDIDYCVSDINDKINDYLDQQALMDMQEYTGGVFDNGND